MCHQHTHTIKPENKNRIETYSVMHQMTDLATNQSINQSIN